MLTVSPGLTLEQRFENRQRLSAMLDEITDQLDAENTAIKDEMSAAGLDTYEIGDDVLTLTARAGRKTLDKGLLVQLGVSTAIIEQATKEGSGYLQLDVRRRK